MLAHARVRDAEFLGDAFDRQAAVEQSAVGAGPRERVEVDALVVLDHRFDQQVGLLGLVAGVRPAG